jgi:hypothetical protein
MSAGVTMYGSHDTAVSLQDLHYLTGAYTVHDNGVLMLTVAVYEVSFHIPTSNRLAICTAVVSTQHTDTSVGTDLHDDVHAFVSGDE